jgi:hypothetical protein
MLAELATHEAEQVQQTAIRTVKSSSLLKLSIILGTLMKENARLLKEVNRLRVLNGEQPLPEHKL